MKKIYFLVVALCFFGFASAQIVNIPDANFKAKLLSADVTNEIAKDISGNYFKIDVNNNSEIETNEALSVSYLNVFSSLISNLTGISSFINLQDFNCYGNLITSVNFNNNINLKILNCSNNQITSLDISNNFNLINLYCFSNLLTSLDLSSNLNLTLLICNINQLSTLNVTANINLLKLNCAANQLSSINVLNNINLNYLACGNNQLSSINVSSNVNLEVLYCNKNQLTAIDVSLNLNLLSLDLYDNQLTSINVSNNLNLGGLVCGKNYLTTLNIDNNVALGNLDCGFNQLSVLNTNNNVNLNFLSCANNQLQSLNLTTNTNLNNLWCINNQITTLDLRNNLQATYINLNYNQLTSLYIKNGKNEYIDFPGNPNLNYICADESQISSLQDLITQYGYANCHVNSYCSFAPGGTFYTIQGNQKLDSNNNGCDALDNLFPNLKFNISDGTNLGSFISDISGNYAIPVQAGTQTVTPVFENPSYFYVSPANVVIDFPAQLSPVIQNFCVTANGSHQDLEINLLPINPARPGFNAMYKLIYKNKGTTAGSGTLNLTFNDSVLDLVSAQPTATTQTLNNLTWAFTDLQPFESREITFTLNVNSPMETPAVNGGDILNYVATITIAAADETPNDNTFVYNQTVVNSFDPNDKTCLEGATISQVKVGDYVHYMIRFENTGTFPAQNIVVKDMIDMTKFDINSLVPIKGSHSFVTNISAGNKVEFIFENINLPFDNANNDGYVAFKIKTKSTLVSGNTFSNTASIYFDYNFPIITNTATTTIQTLANQDFEFASYFTIYPNPVKDVLKIDFKNSIEVQSINIYNTLGQLVLVIPNAQNTNNVDVSSLKSGNYFIKINSDKGTSSSKFIKQ